MTVVGPSISSTLCYLFRGEGRGRNNKGRKHTVPFPNPLLAAARTSFECCGEGGEVLLKCGKKGGAGRIACQKDAGSFFYGFMRLIQKSIKRRRAKKIFFWLDRVWLIILQEKSGFRCLSDVVRIEERGAPMKGETKHVSGFPKGKK